MWWECSRDPKEECSGHKNSAMGITISQSSWLRWGSDSALWTTNCCNLLLGASVCVVEEDWTRLRVSVCVCVVVRVSPLSTVCYAHPQARVFARRPILFLITPHLCTIEARSAILEAPLSWNSCLWVARCRISSSSPRACERPLVMRSEREERRHLWALGTERSTLKNSYEERRQRAKRTRKMCNGRVCMLLSQGNSM